MNEFYNASVIFSKNFQIFSKSVNFTPYICVCVCVVLFN